MKQRSTLAAYRAWSYRERWWEWDPGAAVVWAILRLSGRAGRFDTASEGTSAPVMARRPGQA